MLDKDKDNRQAHVSSMERRKEKIQLTVTESGSAGPQDV